MFLVTISNKILIQIMIPQLEFINRSIKSFINSYDYISSNTGGTFSLMVVVIVNGIDNLSSNP